MSIVVGITSYNRNQCLYELVERLKIQGDCHVIVVDDGSDVPVESVHINKVYRQKTNLGRNRWWKTVGKLWSLMANHRAQYYYMIPDDALPLQGYFNESIRLWNSIQDPKKIALHLTNNGRIKNWTNFKRVDYNDELYLSQTTEFHFMAPRNFFQYKPKWVDPRRWQQNPLAGSGVGEQINRFWIMRRKRNIYGVKKSLIKKSIICTESVMNPQARKEHGWTVL